MKIIKTPLRDEDIADLRIGDIVYLSGILATGRDAVHRRVVHEGLMPPFDFSGSAIFHAGPIVRKIAPRSSVTPDGAAPGCGYELVSIGPTSSIRMEDMSALFIEKTGIKIMIGKGGMGEKTAAACRAHKVIHCVYPGGCAVLGAGQIDSIKAVYWEELGMPECIWVMEARSFGPLIVSIDTLGNNLFTENAALLFSKKEMSVMRLQQFSMLKPNNVSGGGAQCTPEAFMGFSAEQTSE
jgi:L(+)-tartrate dehydratase beta subunit